MAVGRTGRLGGSRSGCTERAETHLHYLDAIRPARKSNHDATHSGDHLFYSDNAFGSDQEVLWP